MLLVIVGAPGSGKSYFAERLCKEYGFFHLQSDEIRKYFFPKPTYSPEENATLFSFLDFMAEKLIASGIGVFYDANFTKRDYRTKLQRAAQKYKAVYKVIWMKTPMHIAIKRAESRKYHRVDKKVVLGMHNETEFPEPENEPVVIIEGTKPYKMQKQLMMKQVSY